MMSAGEASGDLLAAEWVRSFRAIAGPVPPIFFGAGGANMAAAGVELSVDLTRHALIGIPTYGQYRRLRHIRDALIAEAVRRQPDLFIGVDFFGFNGSLAREIRAASSDATRPFHNWRPKIVQYVSPQVWASRPGRAQRMSQSHDLLLSILPFEKEWYRQQAPTLRVEFVGHPLADRHRHRPIRQEAIPRAIVLLPGSRKGELLRHLPLVLEAGERLKREFGVVARLNLPPSIDLVSCIPNSLSLPQLFSAPDLIARMGRYGLRCRGRFPGVPSCRLFPDAPPEDRATVLQREDGAEAGWRYLIHRPRLG